MTIPSPLTFTHLRFDCRAQDEIAFHSHRAGNALRGALGNVILNAVCPKQPRQARPTPEHAEVCPACWLLAHEAEPGRVHRAYALAPPLPPRENVRAGEHFSFALTMFGEEGFYFLPYLVLAVPEMGRLGVGPGRGNFTLEAIWAANPLQGQVEQVLAPGENVVQIPETRVGWDALELGLEKGRAIREENAPLVIRFLTPMRLIESGQLVKAPDFGVFFRRLLKRLDELGGQFSGQTRRAPEEVQRLHALADQVRLVDADVRWVELKSHSRRTRQHAPLSGFVGTARYRAKALAELLPWLMLGQGVQAGKSTVKGNGVFEIAGTGEGYWEWLRRM
ncbi:MAG: CRISPR system precrRNA processing endoribonuclease RAMP protein Cas6 [Chloroflexi bacterium]|nr:CRISPR system precrRNA processing endoribonuclease RAMP protein Cas6 [Chloroflexota bacterium]